MQDWEREIIKLCRDGDMAKAINFCQSITKEGYWDAKERVNQLQATEGKR